jgi:hypothetical protein
VPCRQATVEFAAFGPQTFGVRLLEAEVDYDDMLQYVMLHIDPDTLPPLSNPKNVAGYGTALTEALSAHNAVRAELQQMFGTVAPNQAKLDFAIGTSYAEMFRWETLCDSLNRFLALNGDCSLKRIPISGGAPYLPLRTFTWPIKLVAFLSPAGIPAAGEFREITKAVEAARANGLDVQASIYLGEQDLLDEAQRDIAAGNLLGVTVRPIPATAVAIEQALKNDRPQLLHFFCHGHADAGIQLLELASISDHDIEAQNGSIYLSIERLVEVLLATGTVWATILNSCSGARQVPRLYSMSGTLAKAASPITIGMAEPITDVDATLFARAFYETAFELLRQSLGQLGPGLIAMIDLGPAVGHARKELYSQYMAGPAEAFGQWCLPILYQRKEPLRVARMEHPQIQQRIEAVAQALRALPATAPVTIRTQLLAILDQDPKVPDALRPDRFGNPP